MGKKFLVLLLGMGLTSLSSVPYFKEWATINRDPEALIVGVLVLVGLSILCALAVEGLDK